MVDQPSPSEERAIARKARKEQRRLAALRSEFLRRLMSDPEGRRWMWSLLSMCGTHSTPYSGDALATAFNCGQQNIGLMLTAELTSAVPELYLKMQLEQANDRDLTDAFGGTNTGGSGGDDAADGDADD